MRTVVVSVYIALFALGTHSAMAQGCAMCYQNAAGPLRLTGNHRSPARISILLLPAGSLFLGIFAFPYITASNTTR